MYLRADHADATIPMLRQLIRKHPLGILTTAISSHVYPLLQSSHIPFLLDVQDESDEAEKGVLRGHLARQNPQAKAIIDSLKSQQQAHTNFLEEEVLILFNSPVNHYVTPKFYTDTKPVTGKVVPTWNYAAAQVYGRAKIYYESSLDETTAFLSQQISDLSQHAEESIMGYTGTDSKPTAWMPSDAPERYTQLLKKNIIGIEIVIDRLEGKFKMSQESSKGDREGVIKGFQGLGSESGLRMAEMVSERGRLKDARSK